MSAWPGKYVIGLTGDIATGKSVVRKMLEHLGAYGVNADALANRPINKGMPGYRRMVDSFGKWILADDQQINQDKIQRLLVANPDSLQVLEGILHPLVRDAIDKLVRSSDKKVVVIEATKLLERCFDTYCDTIWAADAPQEVRVQRLVQRHKITSEAALERILAQNTQADKLAKADVIIHTNGKFEATWAQVAAAWQSTVPVEAAEPERKRVEGQSEFLVQRALPQEAAQIAAFITRVSQGKHKLTRADIMAAFGEKAFSLLLRAEIMTAFGEKAFYILLRGDEIVGTLRWQDKNQVAWVDDVYIQPDVPLAEAMQAFTREVEQESQEARCEIMLLFLSPDLAQRQDVWQPLGYEARAVEDMEAGIWREVAAKLMRPDTVMLFKPLREAHLP